MSSLTRKVRTMASVSKRLIEYLARARALNDRFTTEKMYVDIANGDLIAGILLSQILYWYSPSKDGNATKLRVVKDGELWLAKGRDDWWEECRITPYQFDRAVKTLCDLGIIEKKVFKFNGNPTIHLRIVEDRFLELVDAYIDSISEQIEDAYTEDRLKRNAGDIQNGFSILSENRLGESAISLTDTTTDTTTEITKERKEYKEKKESRKSNDLLFTVEEKKKADKELEMFNAFWKAYPKKQKRAVALKCWQKLKVDDELFAEIMAGMDRLKQSRQWREQDGKFIPMPSTFLNERRWEDEPEVDKQALVQKSNVLEEQRVKRVYELTPEHPPFHDDIGNTLKWMELVKEWEAKYGMTFQEWEDKNGPLREYMRKHYGRG